MSEENKTIELSDEDLEKASGGKSGNCKDSPICLNKYSSGDVRCNGCPLASTRPGVTFI